MTTKLTQIIREELSEMLKEADKKAGKIDAKLEAMRKKITKHIEKESMGADLIQEDRPHKRVLVKTVSDTIDIPVNDLTLHFLNRVKTKNERSLIEMHMGQIYFYAD